MLNKKTIQKLSYFKAQKGATTIMLAFFIMNVLLITSLTTASIMIFDIKMSAEIANSIPAFYAADSAAEKCLYQARILADNLECNANPGSTSVSLYGGTVVTGATRVGSVITSVGQFVGTQRKVEIFW